jgi:hypothetical protein
VTPGGLPAVFASSAHAWFALRIVYLADVAHVGSAAIEAKERLYAQRWARFVRHGDDMVRLASAVDAGDLATAAELWAAVSQFEVDDAFSTVICEREPYPSEMLAVVACRHFALHNSNVVPRELRDPKRAPDNQAAWDTAGGRCQSCGTATVSERQYKRLRSTLRSHPELFDLTPQYRQVSGTMAPLWSNRVLIAAKGVADHVVAWSEGGRTEPTNLANVCAGCNYSRGDSSLDVVGVAAYRIEPQRIV